MRCWRPARLRRLALLSAVSRLCLPFPFLCYPRSPQRRCQAWQYGLQYVCFRDAWSERRAYGREKEERKREICAELLFVPFVVGVSPLLCHSQAVSRIDTDPLYPFPLFIAHSLPFSSDNRHPWPLPSAPHTLCTRAVLELLLWLLPSHSKTSRTPSVRLPEQITAVTLTLLRQGPYRTRSTTLPRKTT